MVAPLACSHQPAHTVAPLPICAGSPATDRSALMAAPALVASPWPGCACVVNRTKCPTRGEASGFRWLVCRQRSGRCLYEAIGRYIPPRSYETIYRTYAARPESVLRRIMAPAYHAKIVDGDYTISELIAVENRIAYPRVPIPGFTGVGTSLLLNRVKLISGRRERVCGSCCNHFDGRSAGRDHSRSGESRACC